MIRAARYTLISVHYPYTDDVHCSPEDILIFFSGASQVPPLGFEKHPTLTFLHSGRLATASTCDLQLRIPTVHGTSYPDFREAPTLSRDMTDSEGSNIVVWISFCCFLCLTLPGSPINAHSPWGLAGNSQLSLIIASVFVVIMYHPVHLGPPSTLTLHGDWQATPNCHY